MNISKDTKTKGIIAYIMLIFSALFIDYPIIALLAILCFLAGTTLLIFSLLSLKKENSAELSLPKFSAVLVIVGTVALAVTMEYTGVKFFGHDVVPSSYGVADIFYPASLQIVYIILIADFVATSIIVWGIKLRSGMKCKNILPLGIILFISVPIIAIIIKILFHRG